MIVNFFELSQSVREHLPALLNALTQTVVRKNAGREFQTPSLETRIRRVVCPFDGCAVSHGRNGKWKWNLVWLSVT